MASPGGQGGGSGWEQLIPLVLIFVVFYFFMIRPQTKKAKEQKKYRESLTKGDKVVTIGGIHGKIVDMDDSTFILEMIDKSRIKVEKSAISMESSMALAKENGN
ncbi:MAG: preprotein translocase subunit YajC [Flavobacteriales bacterium]|nr:preprotein translocase subunit YajC [Flavobacteriales bacterium]